MTAAKARILIVDDQPNIRRLLEEVFSEEGYEVMSASNGLGALDEAEKDPAVILMDMKMPGMDGIEALKELREMGLAGRVIMMTAYGELDLVKQAELLGARSYVTKPFDIIKLAQMVNDFVEGEVLSLRASGEMVVNAE